MGKEKQVRRPCEAPVHVQGCSGNGDTRDHFTPRSIGNLLQWTQKQISAPMNIQHISVACHREKDNTTSKRVDILREQLSGRERTLEEYVLYFQPKKKTEIQAPE